MSVRKVVAAAGLVFAGVAAVFFSKANLDAQKVFEPAIERIEPASPCPWRDGDSELTEWFPGATSFFAQDVILSAKRSLLQERLHRPVRPEEMALHTYTVVSNQVQVGTVLTRRIKGKSGAIEIAVGLNPDRRVQRFKVQRIREPEQVKRALDEYQLESRFREGSVTSDFVASVKIPPMNVLNPSAQEIAEQIASELSALLIVYEAGHSEAIAPHH